MTPDSFKLPGVCFILFSRQMLNSNLSGTILAGVYWGERY